MKRIFLFFFILLLLLVSSVYIFIPSVLHISESITLSSSVGATFRNVTDIRTWEKWWPNKKIMIQSKTSNHVSGVVFNGDTFNIYKQLYNDLEISINQPSNNQVLSTLLFIPTSKDTLTVNWRYDVDVSLNPFTRIKQYRQNVVTRQNMTTLLYSLKNFFSKKENIYNIPIEEVSTIDTLLISTSKISSNYPKTDDIYSLIKKLRDYMQKNKAIQTDSPLLNITKLPNENFKTMVALPINCSFPPTESIIYKRMMPGRFLTTTVRGGDSAIRFAEGQIQKYFTDNQRTSAALPFQILVTNRMNEKDTAEWITKLYFPVMN